MSFELPKDYWTDKLIAYMHDPFDKVFGIQGHNERAADLLEIFGEQTPNDAAWRVADQIAAGLSRGQVPSYSRDESKSGAVDFFQTPVITHPTSRAKLKIELKTHADNASDYVAQLHAELKEYLKARIGIKDDQKGLSGYFQNDHEAFERFRFIYAHLLMRFDLSEHDIGGLGSLWHRLPADSRFPDHSIWQHNALTSAIYSCLKLGTGLSDLEKVDKTSLGLMVFSLTPVQPFIAKARKLRDYWTGSLLLSWLSFEGIAWVMENLGPDHIIYPSLTGQPLVSQYIKQTWPDIDVTDSIPKGDLMDQIATFPNKFLFLIPLDRAREIGDAIGKRIRAKWMDLTDGTRESLCKTANINDCKHLNTMFERQASKYWDTQWAATGLLNKTGRDTITKLLATQDYEAQFETLKIFESMIAGNPNFRIDDETVLYSTTHSLVQHALAASKVYRPVRRAAEPGEKCGLCGEFEALHALAYDPEKDSAHNYKKKIDEFWKNIAKNSKSAFDFNDREHLCAICATKRLAYKVSRDNKTHLLRAAFKFGAGFPSTTEMAITDYYERLKKLPDFDQNEISKRHVADYVHKEMDTELPDTDINDALKPDIKSKIADLLKRARPTDQDKYYAILMMDGDKMGDLINGINIGSTWESTLHPDIATKVRTGQLPGDYHEGWKKIINNKRLVTPDIHLAISEALGDFSLYGVPGIIKEHNGRLIYAGGDDVCAILPVSTAFEAAMEIQKYYRSTFRVVDAEGSSTDLTGTERYSPQKGKLSINLGNAEKISISAGILYCHHKESLTGMIKRAHTLLDKNAKDEAGRSACAIEIRKRSGGSRYFSAKWDAKNTFTGKNIWDDFVKISGLIAGDAQELSTSLVYRLGEFSNGFDAIIEQEDWESFIKLLAKQVERSGLKELAKLKKDERKQRAEEIAKIAAGIIVRNDSSCGKIFVPEGLIIAGFTGKAQKGGER